MAVVLGVCRPDEAGRVLALVRNVRLAATTAPAVGLAEACPRRGSLRRLPVQQGEKWGYVDLTGALVIPAVYDEAQEFAEGLAAVRSGRQWEYIRPDGTTAFRLDPQGLSPAADCRVEGGLYVRRFGNWPREKGIAVLDVPCAGTGVGTRSTSTGRAG